ncbi:MAG: lipocalin family protein [Clostridia bacterium]|nr:lipocalin family protein [Clostridia bacterium]
MKKTIAILLVAVMALTLFAACGKKGAGDGKNLADQIIGDWKVESVSGDVEGVEMFQMVLESGSVEFTFKDNGEYNLYMSFMGQEQNNPGTYKVEGDKMIMDDGEPTPFSIDGNKLTVTVDGASMVMVRK